MIILKPTFSIPINDNKVYKESLKNAKYIQIAKSYELYLDLLNKENAVDFKAPDGIDLSKGELVLTNYNDATLNGNGFATKPYETRVYLFK